MTNDTLVTAAAARSHSGASRRDILKAVALTAATGILASCETPATHGIALNSKAAPSDEGLPALVLRAIDQPAEDAFERGTDGWQVERNIHGPGIVLYDRVLVEDDGPGVGSDADFLDPGEKCPTFPVGGSNQVKKILHVDDGDVLDAKLFVKPGAVVEFNGQRLESSPRSDYADVPPNLVKKGDNEVVLTAEPNAGPSIKWAPRADILRNDPDRKDRAQRSFSSSDGGATWNAIAGEFMVRLHLVQYVREGFLVSRVIDVAAKDRESPVLGGFSVDSVKWTPKVRIPEGTTVQFLVRSGTSPVYEPEFWSDWRPAASDLPAPARAHRYWQWKALLKSDRGTATPVLEGMRFDAAVTLEHPPEWAGRIKSGPLANPEIQYTFIPFAYENPLHPKLIALRQKYHLDELIAGSKTELEKLVRLRHWVANQWKFRPPTGPYPAWDADAILAGKVGFCVQYAITYMECALSLGYQARFVFGAHPGTDTGGHEVCEVWSNDFQKWIYMDVSNDFHHINPQTGVPLSMLDVHDLMLKTYFGEETASLATAPAVAKTSAEIATCFHLDLVPGKPQHGGADGLFDVPRRWMQIRYMPRNNYDTQAYPAPIRQGENWDWSDYWVWEGAQMQREQWEYRHFTARRNDLNWTLNQVRFDAALGDKPASVRIQMGTVTPGFATFLVNINGDGWRETGRAFNWNLRPGKNRLEMRTRTSADIEGPVSRLELTYA